MSEDIAPYGNSEPEITRLRMQLHHAEIQRDAFTFSLRKEVLKVAREAIAQAAKESEGTSAFLKAEVARLTGELTGLKSEADRLKALVGDFDDYLKHKGEKHAFEEWHAWRYQRTDAGPPGPVTSTTFVNVDPLLREAIASAELAKREGGAS